MDNIKQQKDTFYYLRDLNEELTSLTLCRRLLVRQLKILENMNV